MSFSESVRNIIKIFIHKPNGGVPPIRWYHLLSTWIFLLSVLQLPTFPLNILALSGCLEIFLNPHKEHWVKNLYIIFLHVAPFLWIRYDLSTKSFYFAAAVILAYLIFIWSINNDPFYIYHVLLEEDHKTLNQFTRDRFGFETKAPY